MADLVKKAIDDEIMSELEELNNLAAGSKERASAIEDLSKLYKLRIEEKKNERELSEKRLERLAKKEADSEDNKLKERELDENKKERFVRIVIAGVEIVVPIIFYSIFLHKGFKFEETGTLTSSTFKNFINHLRPTKK